jgi:hypothetical protein
LISGSDQPRQEKSSSLSPAETTSLFVASSVTKQGGRDVAKTVLVVLAVTLAAALAGTEAIGQVSGGPLPDLKVPFVGSALTCSSTAQEKIVVPNALAERANLKARVLNLLRLSLLDDTKGIVNIARENEIRKLANKLKETR